MPLQNSPLDLPVLTSPNIPNSNPPLTNQIARNKPRSCSLEVQMVGIGVHARRHLRTTPARPLFIDLGGE